MLQLSSFKGRSNEYQRFLGTWWLKLIPHSGTVVYRKLNYIHKVVHWDKWTLERVNDFFLKYSRSILLKYSWSIVEVYLKYTYSILIESTAKVYLKYTSSLHYKYWLNLTKCTSNVLLFLKYYLKYTSSVIQQVEVYLKYIWSML